MPSLTISTDIPPTSRSSSPTRPSMSPITPTLPDASLPAAPTSRQTFTHTQPDQTAVPPPAPEPIAFDSNPDVIALKSAISVLQMQRQRATADIQKLSRIKDAAVNEPDAFIRDLSAGGVTHRGQGQQPPRGTDDDDDGENDDDDDDDGDDDEAGGDDSRENTEQAAVSREWNSIPQPQNVVRCPPINWSQYAVVGESLDKLHGEQITRPTQGTPATVGVGGAYEFKGDGVQEPYVGVAAPYAPTRDKIDRKPRGKK